MKSNNIFLLLVLFIGIYHYIICNPLEKNIFRYTFYNDRRPKIECKNDDSFRCYGMPSGHTETATVVSLLLLSKKYISIYFAITIIFLTMLQRLLSKMHSLQQVFAGLIIGTIYSAIYIKLNNPLYILLFIFLLTLFYIIALIKIIDNKIIEYPEWINKDLSSVLYKKRNVYYSVKILTIISYLYYKELYLFYDWKMLENDLDILIRKIKETNIKFDGVVGIKSGGAILSNYIAKKLNIQYYYIKVSDKEYNCKKNNFSFINDYKKNIFNEKKEYELCEEISEDLSNKNIILIDELIKTGNTINKSINYLLNEKNVNFVLPVTLILDNNNLNINNLLYLNHKNKYIIFPWGYDN
jgi:hypoxanthine phosphoribosyltransferase